ncbi:LysR family transcriptional regulator [Microbacterium hydrocarbonoxydans]|uniref:DNA-binding transcriptional regulator, LysR family n=1 Tax=Microbacterium hydrocarbonoxydans TaxID=273678 RepID=A0A1H4L6M8_9MICO|nr:LysR family transcriptional regulator [Microbacterium hydrocarbonoxydans]SEB66108.1 DNA-binding transcriptional regulator, LysR family [Microbacterium hydrocarbonoxydans]
MTLRQLLYFLGAAELGSFTAVATRMLVTQPAVAEQIRQLERFLEVDLFVRLGRGVRLTSAGEEFLIHARRVVAAAEEAQNSVAGMRQLLGGTVTFGSFGAPAHYGFAELVRDFAAAHPAVRLRLKGRNSSEVADAVRAGDVEAALVVLPIDDDGVDVEPISLDEVLYVSADPTLTRSPIPISRVVASPFVLYEAQYGEHDPTRRQFAERAQAEGIRLEPHFEVEHLDTAVQLAEGGVANTYVPRAVTRSPGFPEGLSSCSFDPPMYDTFAIITRRGVRLSPATRELVRLVVRHMRAVATPIRRGTTADPEEE